MADVVDGCEGLDDGVEQVAGDGFCEPLRPFADVGGIGAAGDGGGDVGVFAGKLDGELGDIDILRSAEGGGPAGGGFDFLGLLEPVGELRLREQPGGEGAGVDDTRALGFEARDEVVREAGVLEGVLVVGEDAIDVEVVEDAVEGFHGIAGKADGSDFPLGFEFHRGGQGFLPDLRQRDEFDVVQEENVEVVGAEAVERDVDGFLDAFGGEIEVAERVAAELGAELVGIARLAAEGDAEQDFRHAATVEGGRVEEGKAEVERGVDGIQGVVELHRAELLAERGGTEGEDGKVDAGGAEGAGDHGWRGLVRSGLRSEWTPDATNCGGEVKGADVGIAGWGRRARDSPWIAAAASSTSKSSPVHRSRQVALR